MGVEGLCVSRASEGQELRDAGMTDYAARIVRFGGADTASLRGGPAAAGVGQAYLLQGIFFSCATDVPGGFDDGHLKQVGDALPYLALAVKSRSTFDVARTLLETYKEESIRSLRDLENASLKGLLRRVIGKIFNDTEIKGWCKEFEARNRAASAQVAAAG